MKPLLLAISIVLSGLSATAQIKNPGFETGRDTAATLPDSWGCRAGHGYGFALDETQHHSGTKSLRIQYTPDSTAPSFAPFSQVVRIESPGLKKIGASVWVKLDSVTGPGGLWCQIWDSANKQIGFKNLEQQGVFLTGSEDWKRYTLDLVLTPDARKLLLGGYLGKGGTIWYDDFSIEDLPNAATPASKNARRYINEVRDIVKKHSIYNDSLDWTAIDRDLAVISAGAKTYADASESGNYILNQLRAHGDNHSFIMSESRTKQNGRENLDGRQPVSRRIDANTGYIAVPGFMSMDKKTMVAFAQRIQSQIRSLDSAAPVTRWIIDLRENTGGNMYPMIAGLGPVLGDGEAGYFVTSTRRNPWYYRDGSCGTGKSSLVKVPDPYRLRTPDPKIAVLIGPQTSSSGEMTTISFIGKPNTRLFGQPSGGYTTANGMHKLPGGSSLLLASSYCADRNGKTYKGKIEPDEMVPESADVLEAAVKWLGE